MSKALREQKCLRPSTACAAQTSVPVQRLTTSASPVFSSISRNAAEPQTGHTIRGIERAGCRSGRLSSTTSSTCGITSPARCTTTVSPTRTSLRAISSSLCRRRVGDDDAADRHRAAAWRPASARRCGRPGSRSPARSSSRARPGICGRPPSAGARDEAEPLLQREIVDLVDDAVDVVAERRALRLDGAEMREHLRAEWQSLRQRIDRQAERSNASMAADWVVARAAR